MADFSSVALSHAHNRFQHIQYYGKPPELNDFNARNKNSRRSTVYLPVYLPVCLPVCKPACLPGGLSFSLDACINDTICLIPSSFLRFDVHDSGQVCGRQVSLSEAKPVA